jgi:predicted Holliday junction resolvase-like endonuclease
MLLLLMVLGLACLAGLMYYVQNVSIAKGQLEEKLVEANRMVAEHQDAIDALGLKLGQSLEANSKILSQKKSSEVRTGQIAENFAPLLAEFPYKPKDCHFLGMPTDFLVFDLDNDRIVFLEVKSGNARESKKQNKIRKIISEGNVFYERMQINEFGAIHSVDGE